MDGPSVWTDGGGHGHAARMSCPGRWGEGLHVESVSVLGQRVMKLTLAPEWKWSRDIKPIVGTSSCQATHTGISVEGTIHCVCDDGSEATYSEGDAYAISPNHDAWCVGGSRAVVYEFAGVWGE